MHAVQKKDESRTSRSSSLIPLSACNASNASALLPRRPAAAVDDDTGWESSSAGWEFTDAESRVKDGPEGEMGEMGGCDCWSCGLFDIVALREELSSGEEVGPRS